MDKNIGTAQTFHSQPPSRDSQESVSDILITPQELSQEIQKKLDSTKSVHFLNIATSTTTLPEKDPIKRLRPELSTLLTCLIKQTRSTVKASHHIELLTTAIVTRDPPRGLRPKVNPRIPDSKNIEFIIEWEEVTNTAALSYTKLLLKNWEGTLKTSKENIENLETRINKLQASVEEWTYIRETLHKIEKQTREDLERTKPRGPREQRPMEEEATTSIQPTTNSQAYQMPFYQEPLPQRRPEDFRGRSTRL